ncbi:MAG: DUF1080 domain-containing protein [Bacteroidota bacterium]
MRFINCLLFGILIMGFGCSPKISDEVKNGWRPLLINQELSNFTKLNGDAEYYVDKKSIVGVSKMNTPNTFLCTKEMFHDFILEFEVWADSTLNSGVQFRSISDPDIMAGRVHGYQVEIESSSRKWAGGIYDEGRRGWLYSLDSNPEAGDAFLVNEWNHYRLEAIGNEIITWVNKVQCTHLIDDVTSSGFIGLQVHSIDDPKLADKKVKWRNIRIKTRDLDNERWPTSPNVKIINKITNKK